MYTVKIISNTVSENLEMLIGFYIDEVIKKEPGALLTFQYQALNGINETIYSCMITVNTSIIERHYQVKEMSAADAVNEAIRLNKKMQEGKAI